MSSSSVRAPNKTESTIGVLSGSGRALAAQFFSFYIRVPVKLFRPPRVDYSWLLRQSIAPATAAAAGKWSENTLYLLWHAVKTHGLRFVPDRLLPPMIVNSVIGAVLYTTYLSSLSVAQYAWGNQYPTFMQSLCSGALAGAAQAVVGTPIDNLALRFDSEILKNPDQSLWRYSRDVLWKIGPRAAFGGIALNLIKESASFGLFFSTFEMVKGPVYRKYRDWWQAPGWIHPEGRPKSRILYPSFILLAGSLAGCALQVVNYPLSKFQRLLVLRFQAIDAAHKQRAGLVNFFDQGWQFYGQAYYKTLLQTRKLINSQANGSALKWFYSGALRYTLAAVPSTSIGLLLFEILRIRYGD